MTLHDTMTPSSEDDHAPHTHRRKETRLQIEQNVGDSIILHWKPSEVRKTLIPRLSDEKEEEIAVLMQRSHASRREAKALLEKAKHSVEIAIDVGEEATLFFLSEEQYEVD